MQDLISVVLTTFNGEKYIKDQVNSIVGQSLKNWELIVVDNNSHDRTLSTIRSEYPKLIGKKIHIYKNARNLGLARSFQNGLKHARGMYIAVCNQDDVWLSHKLKIQYEAIKKYKCGLVYTDTKVVDKSMGPISPSYRKHYLSFLVNPNNESFEELLHDNHISAPTIMFSAKLIPYLFPFSRYGYEDNWIVLHAAMFATIKYIDVSTMLYRQHETNIQGAGRFNFFSLLNPEEGFLEKHIVKKKKYTAFLKDLYRSKDISYYHVYLIAQKIYNHEVLVETLQKIEKMRLGDMVKTVVSLMRTGGMREAQQVGYFYFLTRLSHERT